MKRLDLFSASADTAVEELEPEILQFKIQRFKTNKTAVEFFTPLHYEQGYAYPLLIWLHGPNDDERQIRRIMPLTSTRNFVSVAPRAPRKAGQSGVGYNWTQQLGDIEKSCTRVLDAADLATEKYNVHPNRIFLAGYASGGTMAMRIALRHPEVFAGVATIGGEFPELYSPLRNLESIRNLPTLLMHCKDSASYPEHQLCSDLKLLHTAGMKLDLRQYLCEQELTTDMLGDLNSWLMNNVTGSST